MHIDTTCLIKAELRGEGVLANVNYLALTKIGQARLPYAFAYKRLPLMVMYATNRIAYPSGMGKLNFSCSIGTSFIRGFILCYQDVPGQLVGGASNAFVSSTATAPISSVFSQERDSLWAFFLALTGRKSVKAASSSHFIPPCFDGTNAPIVHAKGLMSNIIQGFLKCLNRLCLDLLQGLCETVA